jgi:hypothetical protein
MQSCKLITCSCVCCFNIAVLIFAIIIMSSVSTVTELATVDLAYLEQIRDDWAAQPAVALTLRSAETGCKENENVAFSQYWPGTHEGCSNVGVETVD